MLPPLKNLIDQLARLPGLGKRSAARLAFYLLNQPESDLIDLAQALRELKSKTKTCPQCFNLMSEAGLCAICADKRRRQNLICVIEDIMDIIPIERTGQFDGVYHILGGLISPPDGAGPEKIHLKELIARAEKLKDTNGKPPEIILALNPTIEGDTTALYIERALKSLNIKVTKLSRGLATGSDLEYTDETTLVNALKYRH